MTTIKLKVCGMREQENIRQLSALKPDYIGFIFYPSSPRYVGPEFQVPSDLREDIKRVGVFVNESTVNMVQAAREHRLDYLQLHGTESAQQCEELKKADINVIKVFSIDDTMDFKNVRPYQPVVDFFLFDTKGKYFGGNAMAFNWAILGDYNQRIPFFLSGGVSLDNISSIKELDGMNLHAVDINSSVEISPGIKDIDKVNDFKVILNRIV